MIFLLFDISGNDTDIPTPINNHTVPVQLKIVTLMCTLCCTQYLLLFISQQNKNKN